MRFTRGCETQAKRILIVEKAIRKRAKFLRSFFVFLSLSTKLVFGADFDTYPANASPADVLEMLFHILGTFFRVEVAFAVRGGKLAVDCARGTSLLADGTVSATVFNDGAFALYGAIG